MANKIVRLTDAVLFAKDSGYVLAVYERKDGKYILSNGCFLSDIGGNTEIVVKTNGACTDFKDFITKDGMYRFILHNNFNLEDSLEITQDITDTLNHIHEHANAPEV